MDRLMNEDSGQEKSTLGCKDGDTVEKEGKRLNKVLKYRPRISKVESSLDYGADADGDQQGQGNPNSREEKVSSLKTGLIHVARKMPKNAHAHYILGLMYQRLGQPQKAVLAYEKAAEILLRSEEEIDRPEFLSLVQIHHAQCLLLGNLGDSVSEKELEPEEIEEVLSKLKETIQTDIRQAAVWNSLGLILLKTGRVQNAISVLSSLLVIVPDNLDCLANLGIAYLQSGNLELAEKCCQDLILKDQNHPAALINYSALLLYKYGSNIAGAGANGEERFSDQIIAANVAKECLLAAIKADPKAAHLWANLGNAYFIAGDHISSGKCFEKAVKLEPNCMSARYAVATHRIKGTEWSQDPNEQQLSWAGNEMASLLREGDSGQIMPSIGWSGLSMVHKTRHEILSSFETEQDTLNEVEEPAMCCLKQAVTEAPDDAVQWHQLGLHNLRTQQFKASQKYLKAAVSRFKECGYAWSNLGISLHLSEEDQSQTEQVYNRALSLSTPHQAHAIFSNLGNLYRHKKQFEKAQAMFTKSLELKPGYGTAYNNLGLVFVAQGKWEEAKFCFEKALQADPLLDAAKSNMIKAEAMSGVFPNRSSSLFQ